MIVIICIGFHMWISFCSFDRIFDPSVLSWVKLAQFRVRLNHTYSDGSRRTSCDLKVRLGPLDDQRSLLLTDILSWQTSSLHLSTNRITYRSSISSTFVLNTGFITLKIYEKYQKKIPRNAHEKKKRLTAKIKLKISQNHLYDRWDHIPRNSDYLLPIFEKLFYWGYVGQHY